MNRLSRSLFLCFAVLCAVYAGLFAANQRFLNLPVVDCKLIWAGLAGALGFFVAAFKFPPRLRANILALILCLVMVEAMLQACGWLGLIPGVNTKLKVPYGRVYWTREGHGNSIRNRFGWHFPEFDLKAPRRIVAIGDSYVESVEVHRTRNHAALLQQLLQEQDGGTAVFALGAYGTSPAHHIEVLDYARKFFQPQEAVLFICMGDLGDSSPAFNYVAPEIYLYYTLDEHDQLVLNPSSAVFRGQFINSMEGCHRSLVWHLPFLLNSHCMMLQSIVSIRDGLALRKRLETFAARGYARTGMNPAPYAFPQSPDARQAMAVMLKELERCEEICRTNLITLRIVTIPIFPQVFYETQRGTNWTLKIGDYDYLLPDRELAAFAKAHDIPFLSLADYFLREKTSVEQLHRLFLSDGCGHFSEAGHQVCARAVFEAFYAKEKQ